MFLFFSWLSFLRMVVFCFCNCSKVDLILVGWWVIMVFFLDFLLFLEWFLLMFSWVRMFRSLFFKCKIFTFLVFVSVRSFFILVFRVVLLLIWLFDLDLFMRILYFVVVRLRERLVSVTLLVFWFVEGSFLFWFSRVRLRNFFLVELDFLLFVEVFRLVEEFVFICLK